MKTDIAITPDTIAKHGITTEEYERIKKILGREPNITELGIFSVMWWSIAATRIRGPN